MELCKVAAKVETGILLLVFQAPVFEFVVRGSWLTLQLHVGGVAQWLGRRGFFSIGLSLTCVRSMVDRCKLSSVGEPARPTQPSIPLGQ